MTSIISLQEIAAALLTGGGDKPYAFGLATELISKGASLDLIGSDELDCPEFHSNHRVHFLNLRGDQNPNASFLKKMLRLTIYYIRLVLYAAGAKPKIFHILWNNKFELIDRTVLTLYYKCLGKKIVLTVHNVNTRKRDSRDSTTNRLTLQFQYRLASCIFVHTEQMKCELAEEFGVDRSQIKVIPFGINNAVPNTKLTATEARKLLNIPEDKKTILFFGNITPYKGLEFLVSAFKQISAGRDDYRLIIAGRPKNFEAYWAAIRKSLQEEIESGRVLVRAEFIPDEETEVYFKAADVLALPYRQIYQSGVLFLGYSFGLPVLAADVGSLKDEIVSGQTGFVFRSGDSDDLATTIEKYFESDLYSDLCANRQKIRDFATERHSWDLVGQATMNVYADLLQTPSQNNKR